MRAHRDPDLAFDATPLVMRKGRLHIPQQLLEDFLGNEDTAEAASTLMAEHAKEFLSEESEYTMARLELAKQGMAGKAGAAGAGAGCSVLQEVHQMPEDPQDHPS